MAQNADTSAPRDMFEEMRKMRDSYLDATSKAMIDFVNSDAYTEATGSMMEGYLNWATPFRQSLDTIMRQSLEQMSLPSRQEVAVLAERFTNVEKRLDDLDAKMDAIAQSISELSRAMKSASAAKKASTSRNKTAATRKAPTSVKTAPSGKRAARRG